ncbi:MAG TPA: helix-turn-helix transcriptional regulator [Candidatus Saccharimonadales bacterium]
MNPQEKKYLQAFGKRLAEVRKSRGLTQEGLAEMLDISSVSITYLETGRRWPRLLTLQRIAKALKTNVSDLFKGL